MLDDDGKQMFGGDHLAASTLVAFSPQLFLQRGHADAGTDVASVNAGYYINNTDIVVTDPLSGFSNSPGLALMKRNAFVVFGVLTLLLLCYYSYSYIVSDSCGPFVADSIDILGTAWRAEVRFVACGFGIGGGLDIVAINKRDHSILEIAHGNDVLKVAMASVKRSELNLIIPNRSDINISFLGSDNIKINIKYTPRDDAEDRLRYLQWSNDKARDANRDWFCENVMPGIPDPGRRFLDESFAYTYYIPHGSRSYYCKRS